MKLIPSLAIVGALLVAGCGGSTEEAFHAHQVAQVVRQIRFMEGLSRLTKQHQDRGEWAAAERNERMGLRIQTHLGVRADQALVDEACEEVSDSSFCIERK